MKRLCTILGIARSSFYYWCRTAADRAARQAADAKLAARIRAVHRESGGTYGVPQNHRWLRADVDFIERFEAGRPRIEELRAHIGENGELPGDYAATLVAVTPDQLRDDTSGYRGAA